jgi:dethiobiotin synthetase
VRGLFVTGTDTGVGKTVAAAALMLRYRDGPRRLRYWKPIQTGIEHDDDTATVRALIGRRVDPAIAPGLQHEDEGRVVDAGVRLAHALSPHLSARRAGRPIDIETLLQPLAGAVESDRVIVEGAGGVLVPLNESVMMVDLMVRLALPALIVARSGLGTINHTLLTVEALRSRSLTVAGVLMVGPPNAENAEAIATYGRVPVVGTLPWLDPLTPEALAAIALTLDADDYLRAWLE